MAQLSRANSRIQWLCETISNYLGIFDINIAEQMLVEHSNLFYAFLNNDIDEPAAKSKQVLFVWRSFYDKLVEETITALEEGN